MFFFVEIFIKTFNYWPCSSKCEFFQILVLSDSAGVKFVFWKKNLKKSMYGKKYMGIERSTFLFDENSKLIKVWRNVKVKNHVNEVLNFLDSID